MTTNTTRAGHADQGGATTVEKQRREIERAYAEAERARTEIDVLVRLAQVTIRSERPDDIYEPAFDAVRDLFAAERSAILLFDESDRMRFHAWRGLSDSYRAAVDGHSPWVRAQQDVRPILIPDVSEDETLAVYRPAFGAERIRAIGLVPLIARRQLLGKLMLYWDHPRTFSTRDDELALAIASQVAEALERARLHEVERRSHEAERIARTQAQAAQAHMAFLAEASVQLSSSLEYQVTLRKVAELVVPRLADWCVVDVAVGPDDELNRVAVVHVDPDKVEFVRELQRRFPIDAHAQLGIPQVLRTGCPELYTEVSDELLRETGSAPERTRLLRSLQIGSAMIVPIKAGARTLGVISFVTAESGRRYGPPDLQMAEELGRRAGIAIENARAYDAVRVAEAKLRVALSAGRMGVWEWSIATGRVSWSPTLEAIHGIEPGTFPGTFEAYQSDMHPDDRDALLRSIRETLETKREHHVEYRIVRPDGQVRWVAGHGSVVALADGQTGSMIGVCMDITERKQTERARAAAAAALEQTLHENELFAGILAHDLRSPLAAIITAVQHLTMQHVVQDERVQKPLLRVLATGERMTRLIDQLLDFTRARVGGGFELQPRRVDLAALYEQVASELELAHPDWKLKLESRGDCAGAWDPDRLLQVVSNLIANAGQHGVAGAEIRVTLDGTDQDGVSLAIRNRGAIPEALLPKLFAPFRSKSEGRSGGLGLGLFITKQIIVAHGGRIDVATSDASDTTFRVWLPRQAA